MSRTQLAYVLAILSLGLSNTAIAQTCSCASVPLLGTMELATPDSGQWLLATTYEYHDISDLVSGSTSIPDQTDRDRTAQALVLEASRGFGRKWSISALLSAAKHVRDVGGSRDEASGIGDAVLMMKYSPANISIYSKNALSFGLGARLPVGVDDATIDGVTVAEDMQPSKGSYAGIVWAYAARALNDSRAARIYGTFSYTYNGENQRDYQFGHNLTASVGGSYQTQSPWGFNLEMFYSQADRDQRASTEIPNTGGKWLDLIPAVQYHVTPTFALRLAGKFPIKRDLNDALQFTSKYAVRFTGTYVFGG